MAAEIIAFPVRRRPSCFICVAGVQTERGTFCPVFDEFIDHEALAATDCERYEEDPDAR